MATTPTDTRATRTPSPVGAVLQRWRGRRRMSQLDLSSASGVTARHISFVETGRSTPSRAMLETLADALDMPLRDRNDLFLAAGFAAPYRELGFDADELVHVTAAVERILASHDPLPAVVLDRHWTLLQANAGAERLFSDLLDLSAAPQPANVLDLVFDPDGLRPHIVGWSELAPTLVARARREAVGGVPDDALADRLERLAASLEDLGAAPPPGASAPVIDIAFRRSDGAVDRFFSTVTTLGTPADITVQELRIELFHPADEPTGARWRRSGS